ncbi:hypothetical protein [Chitinophaga nivalis]|uniref:Uncharacterized protein n=1 Tax=Chitinophaga nivalis TaxID=2991709 RepID=A0ABT3IKG0_9BACT|nr:hypothetical protein [Chitinophaga nivalis]MCW3465849.1 hypothetical protein [Chitinophaga nivalis]MCW3484460.1 hypothetical protein [Chitinophaga nivalis]
MRPSLRDIQETDRYLLQEMTAGERRVYEARLLTIPDLPEKTAHQSRVHQLIRWLARRDKRRQLDALHTRLLQDQHFAHQLQQIFK